MKTWVWLLILYASAALAGGTRRVNPDDYPDCVKQVLKRLYAAANDGSHETSATFAGFLTKAKVDQVVEFKTDLIGDYHFEKHRQAFKNMGLELRDWPHYLQRAETFGESIGETRVVFTDLRYGNLNKVDLLTREVLVVDPRNNQILTYFVADPMNSRYGTFESMEEFTYKYLFRGERRGEIHDRYRNQLRDEGKDYRR